MIATLFDSNAAAIVLNVGTLVAPMTKTQYQSPGATVPTNLFSHPDQQLEWQNAAQSGATSTGWAGRIADALTTTYNPGGAVPMITSVAGDTLFCNGAASTPVSVSPGNLGGRELQRRDYGVRGAAGYGAGAAAVRFGAVASAGGQFDY